MTSMRRPLLEFVNRDLEWSQPNALKREYELRAGDEIAATLRFRSAFGSLAVAACADGSWSFKRVGFLHPRVTVREEGSETDLAVFKNKTWSRGGTLEFPDGRHVKAATNFWQTRFTLETEHEHVLIEYKTRGVVRLAGGMTVSREGAAMKELPFLVTLGWYLVVMLHEESARVAAAG